MSVHNARLQFRIADRIQDELTEGEALMQFAITTSEGDVRADVAWASPDRWKELRRTDEPLAPEICVEVVSTEDEGASAAQWAPYFEAGAEEVWVCHSDGEIQFLGPDGELEGSERVPGFPAHVSP